MFIDRPHPKRTARAGGVLLMLAGTLGLAATATPSFPQERESTSRVALRNVVADRISALRQAQGKLCAAMNGVEAGQAPAHAPRPSTPVKTQTPPRPNPSPTPFRVSRPRPRRAAIRRSRLEPGRTARTRRALPPPPKPIIEQPAAPVSGQPPGEAPARALGGESPQAVTPSLLSVAAGRRDPFKPWGVAGAGHHAAGEVHGALPPGIRGLVISQLRLEGTVREESSHTLLAVVTNYTNRAYFLKVNDTVYNGVVSKITPEAVYFKENTLDSSGRVATHEIEIKLGSAPGEER